MPARKRMRFTTISLLYPRAKSTNLKFLHTLVQLEMHFPSTMAKCLVLLTRIMMEAVIWIVLPRMVEGGGIYRTAFALY